MTNASFLPKIGIIDIPSKEIEYFQSITEVLSFYRLKSPVRLKSPSRFETEVSTCIRSKTEGLTYAIIAMMIHKSIPRSLAWYAPSVIQLTELEVDRLHPRDVAKIFCISKRRVYRVIDAFRESLEALCVHKGIIPPEDRKIH